MSAESSESRPNVDEILSSIRQMISEEHKDTNADQTRQVGISAIANRSHSVSAETQESEPAEDVLDLSEDFIVTDAHPATPRENEHQSDAEAAEHEPVGVKPVTAQPAEEPSAEAADAGDSAEAGPETADQDGGSLSEEIAPSDVWRQDFQMPVDESGPASPFTAAQAHPESAWPAEEPFDVTELYNRARSISRNSQAEVSAEEPETAVASEQASGESAEAAAAADLAEPDSDSETTDGIELESLTTSGDGENEHRAADEVPAHNAAGSSRGRDLPEPAARPARFTAAEEIEAAFGMPQRGWDTAMASKAASPSAAYEVELETEERDAEIEADAPVQDDAMEISVEQEAQTANRDSYENLHHQAASEDAPGQPDPQAAPEGWQQPGPAPEPAPSTAAFPADRSMQPSAKTLEDSVKELLRPMLQEWLDKNMPRLIEAAMREQMASGQAAARGEDLADDEDSPNATARYGTDE